MESTPKTTFLESLARCRSTPGFIRGFYRRFLSSSPEVARKFLFTDLDRQERMLARSLELAAAATVGDADGLAEITRRAETHDREHLDIRADLYALWLESLIDEARLTDPAWTDDVEAAWRTILGFAIHHMVMRYDPDERKTDVSPEPYRVPDRRRPRD
jgi:hemoglobin-like flavoprotein